MKEEIQLKDNIQIACLPDPEITDFPNNDNLDYYQLFVAKWSGSDFRSHKLEFDAFQSDNDAIATSSYNCKKY